LLHLREAEGVRRELVGERGRGRGLRQRPLRPGPQETVRRGAALRPQPRQ
ncbi:hypothetical protein chiPu_0028407, partial [Chiloscyllium punctatum]|nr:hypothetical protein [Chiloscyllium punctatum]